MRPSIKTLLGCGVLLALASHAAPAPQYGEPVLAWDLKGLASDKVSTVLWTQREGHYTLQVVFATPNGTFPPATSPAPTSQPYPDVRAWVLAPDGRSIEPLRRLAVSNLRGDTRNAVRAVGRGIRDLNYRMEVNYVFPPTAADARAIVLQVDDRYYIDTPRD